MVEEEREADAPGTHPAAPSGPPLLGRRDFLKATVLVAAGAAVGSVATLSVLTMVEQRGPPGAPLIVQDTTEPVTVDHFAADAPQPLVAHWDQAQVPVAVYTVPIRVLEASSRLHGYNTGQHAIRHPTRSDLALVAYDGRCTHLGCIVGWRDDMGTDHDEDGDPDGVAMCPCHLSRFDVYDLARDKPSQPAQRPLDVVRIAFRMHTKGDSPAVRTLFAVERIPQPRYRAADLDGQGAAFALGG